jgi:hypothetical protein
MKDQILAHNHLSEDDLDEVLIGIASSESLMHLAECEPCEARLIAFRSEMAAFNQASIAWSEARSNTISRDIAAHKPTPRLTLGAAWSSAAALVVTFAFGLSMALHQPGATLDAANPSSTQTAVVTHPDHDQDQLASDNAMLAAIDSEMGTPQPAQLGLYQPVKAHATAVRRAANMQEQD